MLKRIEKKLEKITDKKEQIKYLLTELKKTKDKKVQDEIKGLINEIVQEEDLEERINIQAPNIEVPTRKFETPTLPEISRETQREEREDELPEVTYDRITPDYIAHMEEVRESLLTVNPTERDILSVLDLPRARITENYELRTEQAEQQRNYMTAQEQLDEFDFQGIQRMDFAVKSMDVIEILQRQKTQHIKPKYELK